MYWKRILSVAAVEVALLIFIIYHNDLYHPSMGLGVLLWVAIAAGANISAGLLALLVDRKVGAILLASAAIAPSLLLTGTSTATGIYLERLYDSAL